jgi:hypothetical protein
MTLFTREPGYTFTNDDIVDFWLDSDGPGGEVLVDICDHEAPGIPLHMPIWSGYQLVRLTDGDFLEQVPDANAPHDFGRLIFRGSHLGEADITQLVVGLVTRNQLEIPVAFAFHFDSSRFGENAGNVETLRSRFWSTWSGISAKQQSLIDQQLGQSNPAYAAMVAFLEKPGNPRFRGLLESATKSDDLSPLYELPIG